MKMKEQARLPVIFWRRGAGIKKVIKLLYGLEQNLLEMLLKIKKKFKKTLDKLKSLWYNKDNKGKEGTKK